MSTRELDAIARRCDDAAAVVQGLMRKFSEGEDFQVDEWVCAANAWTQANTDAERMGFRIVCNRDGFAMGFEERTRV